MNVDFLGMNYQSAEELLDAVIAMEQNSETNNTHQHPGLSFFSTLSHENVKCLLPEIILLIFGS